MIRQTRIATEAGSAPIPNRMSMRMMLATTGSRTSAPAREVRGQASSSPPPISTRAMTEP